MKIKQLKMIKLLSVVCLLLFEGIGQAQNPVYTTKIEQRVGQLISQMTLDEKLDLIGGTDNMFTNSVERLGIPQLKMSDGPQGLATLGLNNKSSTAYPSAILLAATWNEELARRYGESLGDDCRSRGIHILLGPGVNICRTSLCGRNFEYLGEDPFLTARMSTNYIKGVQGRGVMATIKHFIANNTEINRHYVSADVDERTLHEIYFPAFKSAVQEANVALVMTSYNKLNGIYTAENPWLIQDVLRSMWGFKGIVISDWGSTHFDLPTIRSGLDLEMPYANHMNPTAVKYYLRTGDITEDVINEKVRHILSGILAYGFDCRDQKEDIPINNPKSDKTAYDVAAEGLVLLKNQHNILPINIKNVKKIAVVGKNALKDIFGGGSGEVKPFHYTTLLDGLKEEAKKYNILVDFVDFYECMPDIVYTDTSMTCKGFYTEYFGNKDLKGKPVKEYVDTKINHAWLYSRNNEKPEPDTNFSIRWSAVLKPNVTDEYSFEISGDDGYRLYIDNEEVVKEWKSGPYRRAKYRCKLEANHTYKFRLEYYQGEGDAMVNMVMEQKNIKANPFVAKLNNYDLVVANFGYFDYIEGENRDRSFNLTYDEEKVVNKVIQTRIPIVGIVNAGGNIGMQNWEPKMDGLMWAWYAGQNSGTVIARTLFGEINPSGKLPVTFEKKWEDNPVYKSHFADADMHVRYEEGIFVGYRGYDKFRKDVQYPFGYGLSYTTFQLSDMKVGKIHSDGTMDVTCSIKNTGKRAGAEVVQLYIGKVGGLVERPEKELRQFVKVFLNPGESKVITLKINKESFMYYSVNHKNFVVDNGQYNIMLGCSSRDIRLQHRVDINL